MNKPIIAIASGKGGTGKTTISTNLAYTLAKSEQVKLIDCDVEEPNSLLFLKNLEKTFEKTVGIKIPRIDETKCTYCGICAQVCEYSAIAIIKNAKKTFVAEDLCHGCGACSHFCPESAITEEQKDLGKLSQYHKDNITLLEGRLNLAESISTPVLRETLKYIDPNIVNILDAPPGTSCSMVTTVEKADFVILVTEPTPFGVNDLKLAIELVRNLKKPFGVFINKAKLGNNDIYNLLEKENIQLLGELEFNTQIARKYSKGALLTELDGTYTELFKKLYKKILTHLEQKR